MAKAYGWTALYREALRETEDCRMLQNALSVILVLLHRLNGLSEGKSSPEQEAIVTALSDMRVLYEACQNRAYLTRSGPKQAPYFARA